MKRMAFGVACASALAWCGPVLSDEPAQDPAKLFESLDANKDGSLGADEIGEDRKRFFERLVRVGDKNDDSKLSRDEFVAAMSEQERPVETPQSRFGGRERPMFSPGQMFERLDRNGDGKFTKQEIPEQAPAELRERLELVFTASTKSEITREEFEKVMEKYGPPGGREGRRPEGDRRPEGERRPEGDRPREGGREMARDGEGARGREEGPPREGGRPGERPEGMRGPGGFGGFRGPEGGRPGSPLVRVLDRNDDGKLNRDEIAKIVDRFEELDRNRDGELEVFELTFAPGGFGGGMEGRGFGRPGFGGPEGGRPGEGDRGREMAREGDRRPEGDRPRPEGPRDGDRPRPEGPRDGDRPRPEMRDGDRPRPEGRPEGRPEARGEGGPRGERGPGPGPGMRERDGERGRDIFASLDRNGDGVIAKDEAPARMQERFKDLDGNGDGKITPEELREAISRQLGVPGERRERRPELDD